jgi:hypothetical protein
MIGQIVAGDRVDARDHFLSSLVQRLSVFPIMPDRSSTRAARADRGQYRQAAEVAWRAYDASAGSRDE